MRVFVKHVTDCREKTHLHCESLLVSTQCTYVREEWNWAVMNVTGGRCASPDRTRHTVCIPYLHVNHVDYATFWKELKCVDGVDVKKILMKHEWHCAIREMTADICVCDPYYVCLHTVPAYTHLAPAPGEIDVSHMTGSSSPPIKSSYTQQDHKIYLIVKMMQ